MDFLSERNYIQYTMSKKFRNQKGIKHRMTPIPAPQTGNNGLHITNGTKQEPYFDIDHL